MSDSLKDRALQYHCQPTPGKLKVEASKPCATQEDLSLAYTPGVAEPVRRIAENPEEIYRYTSKGNLVAVITNGTAVLGLGNAGPAAAKPVMEGKAVLFKRFADIDCFDIEVDARDADHFIDVVAAIAPGFGGINLEDIAAPDCFHIDQALKARLDIPVFHDDQDGTAVIVAAALRNALELVEKKLASSRIVILGAGAAGIAIARLLQKLGGTEILLVDRQGVLGADRSSLRPFQLPFAWPGPEATLAEAMNGADVFVGVSVANALPAELLHRMAANPVVFALANPDPEVRPEVALGLRSDLIMATGRSDFPNQVNNVLGFPFIFRGALDACASTVNDAMLLAAVDALASLAREAVPSEVLSAYDVTALEFGAEYIIPKPFDPRLLERVAGAVKKAAITSGVARCK